MGLLTAAVWAPNLLSLFVGTWVDHQVRKRRLLIVADLLRCVVLLSLPVAHLFGAISLAQLFAVALLAGVGQVLYQTSYPSFFVGLVRRDQFVEANSLLSGTRSASFVAGPAVAGGLIQAVTAPVAMLVDAATFAVSALLIGRVRVRGPAGRHHGPGRAAPPLTGRDGTRPARTATCARPWRVPPPSTCST